MLDGKTEQRFRFTAESRKRCSSTGTVLRASAPGTLNTAATVPTVTTGPTRPPQSELGQSAGWGNYACSLWAGEGRD